MIIMGVPLAPVIAAGPGGGPGVPCAVRRITAARFSGAASASTQDSP